MKSRLVRHFSFIALLLVFAIIAGCSGGGGSAGYKLTVKVVDAASGKAIDGAGVVVKGITDKTTDTGTVSFPNISGKVTIKVTATGYKAKEEDVTVAKDMTAEIKLSKTDSQTPGPITDPDPKENEPIYGSDPDLIITGVLQEVVDNGAIVRIDEENYNVKPKSDLKGYFGQLDPRVLGATITVELHAGEIIALHEVELEPKLYDIAAFGSLVDPDSAPQVGGVTFVGKEGTRVGTTVGARLNIAMELIKIKGKVNFIGEIELSGTNGELEGASVEGTLILSGDNAILNQITATDGILTILADNVTIKNSGFAGLSANRGKHAELDNVEFATWITDLQKEMTNAYTLRNNGKLSLNLEGWTLRNIKWPASNIDITVEAEGISFFAIDTERNLTINGSDFVMEAGTINGGLNFGSVSNVRFQDVVFKDLVDFAGAKGQLVFDGGEFQGKLINFVENSEFYGVTFRATAVSREMQRDGKTLKMLVFDQTVMLEGVTFESHVEFQADQRINGGTIKEDIFIFQPATVVIDGAELRGNVELRDDRELAELYLTNVQVNPKRNIFFEASDQIIGLDNVLFANNGHNVSLNDDIKLVFRGVVDGNGVVFVESVDPFYEDEPTIRGLVFKYGLTVFKEYDSRSKPRVRFEEILVSGSLTVDGPATFDRVGIERVLTIDHGEAVATNVQFTDRGRLNLENVEKLEVIGGEIGDVSGNFKGEEIVFSNVQFSGKAWDDDIYALASAEFNDSVFDAKDLEVKHNFTFNNATIKGNLKVSKGGAVFNGAKIHGDLIVDARNAKLWGIILEGVEPTVTLTAAETIEIIGAKININSLSIDNVKNISFSNTQFCYTGNLAKTYLVKHAGNYTNNVWKLPVEVRVDNVSFEGDEFNFFLNVDKAARFYNTLHHGKLNINSGDAKFENLRFSIENQEQIVISTKSDSLISGLTVTAENYVASPVLEVGRNTTLTLEGIVDYHGVPSKNFFYDTSATGASFDDSDATWQPTDPAFQL